MSRLADYRCGGFRVERVSGTVAQLHASSAALVSPGGADGVAWGRVARLMQPTDSALVLGSSQRSSVADTRACSRAGVEIVRRRSGGGAVLVQPGAQLWVDFVVPTGDPLDDDDVGRAAWWVGEAWACALQEVGLPNAGVWKGALVRRPWSHLACFALLGAGEVTDAGGRKVVGVSQRRTKLGTLFQCSCLLSWEPAGLADLLLLSEHERVRAARELEDVAGAVRAGSGEQLFEALLAALA